MNNPDSLEVAVARMEAKLDAWLSQQSNNDARVQAGHTDHETRIRRLERTVWISTTVAAVGGGGLVALLRQLMGA